LVASPAGHPCSSCHTSTSTSFLPGKQPSIWISTQLSHLHHSLTRCISSDAALPAYSLAVHRPGGRPITAFVYRCYSLASTLSLTQLVLSDSFLSLNTCWLGCKDALACVEGRRGGLVFFSDPTQSCNTSATFLDPCFHCHILFSASAGARDGSTWQIE